MMMDASNLASVRHISGTDPPGLGSADFGSQRSGISSDDTNQCGSMKPKAVDQFDFLYVVINSCIFY